MEGAFALDMFKRKKMIYTSIEKTEAFVRLSDANGNVMVIPASEAILVDDESGLIAIKAKGTRRNIAHVRK